MPERVVIRSYNPYAYAFPRFTRVLSRDALELYKAFRAAGIDVAVEPEDGSPITLAAKKGFLEVFNNPFLVFVLGIPQGILTSLVATWISNRPPTPIPTVPKLLFEFERGGRRELFDEAGRPQPNNVLGDLLRHRAERQARFKRLMRKVSPFEDAPHRLFLEHEPKIVAWGEVVPGTPGGTVVRNIQFVDDSAQAQYLAGTLRGLSIGSLVTKAVCTICGGEYVCCEHIAKTLYEGRECTVRLARSLVADVSLVASPVNPDCLLGPPPVLVSD